MEASDEATNLRSWHQCLVARDTADKPAAAKGRRVTVEYTREEIKNGYTRTRLCLVKIPQWRPGNKDSSLSAIERDGRSTHPHKVVFVLHPSLSLIITEYISITQFVNTSSTVYVKVFYAVHNTTVTLVYGTRIVLKKCLNRTSGPIKRQMMSFHSQCEQNY